MLLIVFSKKECIVPPIITWGKPPSIQVSIKHYLQNTMVWRRRKQYDENSDKKNTNYNTNKEKNIYHIFQKNSLSNFNNLTIFNTIFFKQKSEM